MKRLLFIAILMVTFSFAAYLSSKESPARTSGMQKLTEEVGPFGRFDEVLPVGDSAPGFSLESVDGRTVTLKSLEGKVVVLEFGART